MGRVESQQIEVEGTVERMDDAGQNVRLSGFLVEGFSVQAGEPGYISVTQVGEVYYPE